MAENEGRIDVAALAETLQQQGARWEPGQTSLTELPYEEQRLHLGFRPRDTTLEEIERKGAALAAAHETVTADAIGYPTSFDWRNYNGQDYVTPIKNQSACGSCVAFGTTAAVEAECRIQGQDPNLDIDLSEASLFYCDAASEGATCETGWDPQAALQVYENTGVPDEACFPYTPGDQPCNQCSDWQDRVVKITGWQEIGDVTDMKTWLSTRGPLVACFTVYADFFAYKNGVYHHVSGDAVGGHCVCIVGYDDTQSCWICKNSWGTGWGMSGFFLIGYGECGIEGYVQAVDGIVATGQAA